jgi:hypothetical protein
LWLAWTALISCGGHPDRRQIAIATAHDWIYENSSKKPIIDGERAPRKAMLFMGILKYSHFFTCSRCAIPALLASML